MMASPQSSLAQSPESPDRDDRRRQIESASWAVFFIWVGIVMLAGLPWAWFLIGVGVVMLGAQIMRRIWNLNIEAFGVAIGVVVLAAGAWDLLALPLPLMPVVLIMFGAYLLWKTLSPTTPQ